MAKRDQGRPSGMGSRDYTDADDVAQRNAREGQRESQHAGSRRQSGTQRSSGTDRDQNRQQRSGNQRNRNNESNRNNRGSSRQNER